VIYGIIRQRARDVVEKAVGEDQQLGKLVTSVRNAGGESWEEARQSLLSHLTGVMKWDERNAALMVEYAGLNLGRPRSFPPDRDHYTFWSPGMAGFAENNLGALSAIGEQKATQFFAQLASAFEPEAGRTYESIFAAWGGDVRERSVDLTSGQVRPREISVDTDMPEKRSAFGNTVDPTIYARVDYLDPEAKISEEEKASCKEILKNLPVIFTFAPMNIIHYRAKFAPHSTEKLTVTYSQYAYSDTKAPSSYQLAYVLHPASLWESFGPINLEVTVPAGMALKTSSPCKLDTTEGRSVGEIPGVPKEQRDIYRGIIEEKTGELFVAVDAERWQSIIKQAQRQSIRAEKSPQRTQQVSKGKGA